MSTLTAIFSMFGVFFLGAIILFLLIYGSNALSFSYLSSTEIGGLAIPMINTLISIGITMAIALPLGLMGGIYFAEYVKSGGKTHRILGTFIDLLTGIPSLIFGIVGLIAIRP
jgi:phosphate transport system permease protein